LPCVIGILLSSHSEREEENTIYLFVFKVDILAINNITSRVAS